MFKYEGADPKTAKRVDNFSDSGAEALAILESQMLNYASRSTAILTDSEASSSTRLAKVYAAGGAAKNQSILNIMADALGCPVSKSVEYDADANKWGDANSNACSVGVAYKAAWGWVRAQAAKQGDSNKANVPFDDFVAECHARLRKALPPAALSAPGAPDENGESTAATPTAGSEVYARAVPWWQALEARALAESRDGKGQ